MLYNIPKTRLLLSVQNSLNPSTKPRSVFIDMLIFLLVMMICSSAQSVLTSLPISAMMMADPAYTALVDASTESGVIDFNALLEYMNTFTESHLTEIMLLTVAAAGLYIVGAIVYCRAFEKRKPNTLGFIKRGFFTEYLFGIAIGAVMICLPALACHLAPGCVKFSFNANVSPLYIVLFFLAFVLQGLGEEAIFRGYLLTSLARRSHPWMAIILSALMFASFHGTNQGFNIISYINIALFGIFAGVFMLKRGSIWAIAAIHTAWNFMQGNILGFSVSGNPTLPSVLTATPSDTVGVILSGGSFGLEGGLGVTVVMIAAFLFVLLMPPKKSELAEEPIPEPDQNNSAF